MLAVRQLLGYPLVSETKLAQASQLPEVTFLTVMDKMQLSCFFIILAILFEASMMGIFSCGKDCEEDRALELTDVVSKCIVCGMWLLVHAWFARVAWREHYSQLRAGANTNPQSLM